MQLPIFPSFHAFSPERKRCDGCFYRRDAARREEERIFGVGCCRSVCGKLGEMSHLVRECEHTFVQFDRLQRACDRLRK